jgi:hypothetical protein
MMMAGQTCSTVNQVLLAAAVHDAEEHRNERVLRQLLGLRRRLRWL